MFDSRPWPFYTNREMCDNNLFDAKKGKQAKMEGRRPSG